MVHATRCCLRTFAQRPIVFTNAPPLFWIQTATTLRGAYCPPLGVVVNVTATNGTDPTFLALYPDGLPNPGTANVLAGRGQTVPNLVMVGMGTGMVTIYNQLGSVDVVADVAGYFTAG